MAIDHLLAQLPTLAWDLVDDSWQDIEDRHEHEPDWHQWGILEHTRRVWTAMMTEVPIFCLAWRVPFIQALKGEFIGDKSKWELLLVTCLVHDLGKWAGKRVKSDGSYSFKGHEAISEQLIRCHSRVHQILLNAQLLPDHLDYIASIAGSHYELGKLRQLGYQRGNFDRAFLKSDVFQIGCEAIIGGRQEYAREIGLIFLADSLAKVEFRVGIETLTEIKAKIQAKGLSSNLI